LLDQEEQVVVVRGLREGSRDAWDRLYHAFCVDIWRYVARLIGSDTAAVADIVQETFLDAARSAKNFDLSRGTIWSWLAGIAHHRVSAYWRQRARSARMRSLAEVGEVDAQSAGGNPSALTAAASHDTAEMVRSILAELSFDHAALLTDKYLNNCTLIEIAAQFGCSVDATKSKLARARREFRTKFEFLNKAAELPSNQTTPGKRPIPKT
jgi:RNA polymerase sigma-70 factor, ECF subfamily